MDRQLMMVLGFLGAIALFMGAVVMLSNQKVAAVGKGLDELARRRGWTFTIDENARWKMTGLVDGLPFELEGERPRKNASRFEMQPHRTRFVAKSAPSAGVVVMPKDAPALALGGQNLAALVLFGKAFNPVMGAPEVAVAGPFGARFAVRAIEADEAEAHLTDALKAGLIRWADSHPRSPALAGWVGEEAVLTTGVVLTEPEEVEAFVALAQMTVR